MVRILLLIPYVLWMAWTPDARPPEDLGERTIAFLGFYVLLIFGIRLYSQSLSRRVVFGRLYRRLSRFSWIVHYGRCLVPIWFAYGLWGLGWGYAARKLLGPLGDDTWQSPGVFLGTLPALLTWMGLWWAQYPADISLRQQNMLEALNADLPVHPPPRFSHYFSSNVRLQILFIAIPVMTILVLRDLLATALVAAGYRAPFSEGMEAMISLAPTAIVFLLAPELLRRVLHTQSLPPGELRTRLENLCIRTGLRYRDILLWRTHSNVGNAAVIGLLPRLRYILMTDLLIETMTNEQIEAVFAHEAGHIKHRHMAWYVVFFVVVLSLSSLVPVEWVDAPLSQLRMDKVIVESLAALASFGIFWLLFGLLSRRFERQADVYAARTMELSVPAEPQLAGVAVGSPTPGIAPADTSHVGVNGARIFMSALRRVATINNIPVAARNWTHGSIASRMAYLDRIAQDPSLTRQFDRTMTRVYALLLLLLVIGACGVTWQIMHPPAPRPSLDEVQLGPAFDV